MTEISILTPRIRKEHQAQKTIARYSLSIAYWVGSKKFSNKLSKCFHSQSFLLLLSSKTPSTALTGKSSYTTFYSYY